MKEAKKILPKQYSVLTPIQEVEVLYMFRKYRNNSIISIANTMNVSTKRIDEIINSYLMGNDPNAEFLILESSMNAKND